MANVIINDTHLTDIANAIRAKGGTTATYLPSEMADAITAIESGSGGGGSSTTTGISYIGFGVVGKTNSGGYNNKITFPVMPQGFNLKTLKWKCLFYVESNDTSCSGIWRYDSTTKKCERMTLGNSTWETTDNIFLAEAYDDTDFKEYFPSGILFNGAASTNYFYVSTMEVSDDKELSSFGFKPIIWTVE
jgi:hypothetical protein